MPSLSPHRAGRAGITASGSSRVGFAQGRFAPDPQAPRTTVALAPVWLSAAVALTRVVELRVSSRVSRQRLRSRGAPLPSAGSRWPRFPVFGSTMKALRLPTLHPSGLLFSPFRTKCARSICVVARALPMPRGQVVGPGFGFRAGCTPDRPSFTWTVPGLSGSLVTHSLTLQRSPTGGSVRRLACSGVSGAAPMTNKHKGTLAMPISRLNGAASSPPVYASRRTLPDATQHSVPAGWLGLCRAGVEPAGSR